MLQSLSPLAFLTIVRNFKFTPVSELAENQSYWGEFVRLNNVLIVVFLFYHGNLSVEVAEGLFCYIQRRKLLQ